MRLVSCQEQNTGVVCPDLEKSTTAACHGFAEFQRSALKPNPARGTSPLIWVSGIETRRISVDAAGSGRIFQVQAYYLILGLRESGITVRGLLYQQDAKMIPSLLLHCASSSNLKLGSSKWSTDDKSTSESIYKGADRHPRTHLHPTTPLFVKLLCQNF